MSIPIPNLLFTQSVDMSVLHNILLALSSRIEDLAGSISLIRQDQSDITSQTIDVSARVEKSEKNLATMFDTVSINNKKVQGLEQSAVLKEDANRVFTQLQFGLDGIGEEVKRLNSTKLDKSSDELELRVRLSASEACQSFLIRKDVETKEYIRNVMETAEVKLIRIAYAKAEEIALKLDLRLNSLQVGVDESVGRFSHIKHEIETIADAQLSLDKVIVAKLDQHEVQNIKLDEALTAEVDTLNRQVHGIMQRVIGMPWADLENCLMAADGISASAITTPGESPADQIILVPDEGVVKTGFTRQMRRAVRSVEYAKGWRAIRTANPKSVLGVTFGNTLLDQAMDTGEAATFRRIDQAQFNRLQALFPPYAAELEFKGRLQLLNKGFPKKVLDILADTPIHVAAANQIKAGTEELIRKLSGELRHESADAMIVVNRDIRSKMSTTKAMELMDQRTTLKIADAISRCEKTIEAVQRDAALKDDMYAALSMKADVCRLDAKADPEYVKTITDEIRQEVADGFVEMRCLMQKTIGDKTLSMHHQLLGQTQKQDAADVAAVAVTSSFSIPDTAAETATPSLSGGNGTAIAKCLSCRQPIAVAAPPSTTTTATTAVAGPAGAQQPTPQNAQRHLTAAARQKQAEDALQETQEILHETQIFQAQMGQRPSGSAGGKAGGAFNLGEWVNGIEGKYQPIVMGQRTPQRPGASRPPSAK